MLKTLSTSYRRTSTARVCVCVCVAGGGGGSSYIWHSADVLDEWSHFSALPGI